MDLRELAKRIDAMLRKAGADFEQLSEMEDHGCIWGYELDEDTSGFISCEDNASGIDIPTVSITVSLGRIDELRRGDLLDLLEVNGDLLGAGLTVTLPMGEDRGRVLLLQTKMRADAFDPQKFDDYIDVLMDLMELYFVSDE